MNALDRYIEEIKDQPALSDSEEQRLALLIQQGDADAMMKLAEANLKYVVKLARQYASEPQTVLDLIGEGNIALIKAASKFTPNAGKRFAAFAAPYVRQVMEKQETTGQRSLDQSIPAGSNNNYTLLNVLKDPAQTPPDEGMLSAETIADIQRLLPQLSPRCREVVSLLYGLSPEGPFTMAEAADIMGLKRERVRQIRNQALRKLKKAKAKV